MSASGRPLTLSIEALAFERCIETAHVLRDVFAQPELEYAMLGLADEARLHHVVATPLLVGQHVTRSTVEQPGRQVLRMRGVIEALSRHWGRRLLPVAFIHRHPRGCEASRTDLDFLHGPFVDQVSTLASFATSCRVKGRRLSRVSAQLLPRITTMWRKGSSMPCPSRRTCGS